MAKASMGEEGSGTAARGAARAALPLRMREQPSGASLLPLAGEGVATQWRRMSDCLGCQVAHANSLRASRALALSQTRSFLARATRMTFLSLPASFNLRWRAANSGTYRRTTSATVKRIDRTWVRP